MEIRNFQSIITDYEKYLQGEKGIAPSTREGYLGALRNWYLMASTKPDKLLLPDDWEWPQVDKRSLEIYLNHFRQERGWKDESIRFQASSIRAFFQYLRERGIVQRNPARSVMPPRKVERLQVPEGEEALVRQMFAQRSNTLATARLLAVLELIYGCGLKPAHAYRVSEIQMDTKSGKAQIVLRALEIDDKPPPPMEVPLSAPGRRRLAKYLALREEYPLPPGITRPFWSDQQGREVQPPALARHVGKAMEKVGLVGGGSMLRKLSAKHFKERGGDMRSLKQFLGFKRMEGLDRYSDPNFKDMAEQFRRFHPRGGKPGETSD